MRGVYARADARRACVCGCEALRGVHAWADARHACTCGCEVCMRVQMRIPSHRPHSEDVDSSMRSKMLFWFEEALVLADLVRGKRKKVRGKR